MRREVHARGLRYRVNKRPDQRIGRRADLVFARAKVAVFVDGCFWHNCPQHRGLPRVNLEYWEPKLHRNAERDAETDRRLGEAGWTVIRVWEHEDRVSAADKVQAAVQNAR